MRHKYIRSSALTLFAVAVVVFSGCTSTNRLNLSDSLSSDTQLRVSSAEQFDVDFQFSPNPEGDRIEASTGGATAVYSLNDPLEGKLTQLMRSKFGSIDQSSENKVTVSVDRVEANTDNEVLSNEGVHSVEMEITAEIVRDGETFTRTIERDVDVDISQETSSGGLQSDVDVEEGPLNEFLQQFVVGVDSFINSNFGVE